MARTIPQRELHNENAKVISAVAAGETFLVTRNGEPVAELRPVQTCRRTFVSREQVAALAATRCGSTGVSSAPTRITRSTRGCEVTSGLLDTSVVIDWHDPAVIEALLDEIAIAAITAAELSPGSHLAPTAEKAAKRRARLQEFEAMLEPIRFNSAAVCSYGLVVAAVVGEGGKPRSRIADLLIAATAHANNLDLHTRKGDAFAGLDELVHVVAI